MTGILKLKAGFTLVELMVVAIIVAILAAVAIPLMRGNSSRAAASEADAALGTARSALRAMFTETHDYRDDPNIPGTSDLSAGDPITAIPGINANDFNGRYFDTADYDVLAVGQNNFTIRCQGDSVVDGIDLTTAVITMAQDGTVNRSGL